MAADKLRPHNPLEYAKLLEWSKDATSILEIGSRYGYTFFDMAKRLPKGPRGAGKCRALAVDYPGVFPWGESGSENILNDLIVNLVFEHDVDARSLLGDSHKHEMIEAVRSYGPFDFVFIDGDHTYNGVRADWENYRAGARIVAFHDIVQPKLGERQELGVWKLWEEIKKEFKTEEFIAPDSKMGIGKVILG